jgi:hypothetical protein
MPSDQRSKTEQMEYSRLIRSLASVSESHTSSHSRGRLAIMRSIVPIILATWILAGCDDEAFGKAKGAPSCC